MLKNWRGGRILLNDSESHSNVDSERRKEKSPVREDHFKNDSTEKVSKIGNG